jgi:hypothetical protein
MIKRLLLLVFFPSVLFAQNTLVTATITDAGAQSWNNGTYTFRIVGPPGYFGNYQLAGSPYTPVPITGSLDGTGTLTSVSIPSNTSVTPTGTFWSLTVCSAGTQVCFTSGNLTITGASQNISSSVVPPAIVMNCGTGITTYQDAEVRCNVGGTYYSLNLTSLRVCQVSASSVCSTWASVGGGGLPTGLSFTAPTLTVSTAGSGNGVLALSGNTSGTATFTAPAVAGTTTNSVVSSNQLNAPTFLAGTAANGSFKAINGFGTTVFQANGIGGNGGVNMFFGASGVGVDSYNFQGAGGAALSATTNAPDFPIIQAVSATTPTTPVGSTNILASAPAGTYEISYYSVVTTTGTVGTSFSLNFIYTDAQQAQTIAAFTNSTFTAGNVNQGTFIVQNQATNNINYSITEAGAFTVHPVLALKLVMKRIF